MKKDKERVIATKINANIFGKAQLIDMQLSGDWKKGDLKELLEKALGLYSKVGKLFINKEKLSEELFDFLVAKKIIKKKEKK